MKYIKKYESINLEFDILKYTSMKSSLQNIRQLINLGAPLECTNVFGRTPLLNAANVGFYKAIELLINNGANIYAVDENNNNVFILLMNNHQFKEMTDTFKHCVDFLMLQDIDISHKNNKGEDVFYSHSIINKEYIFRKNSKYIQEKYPEKWKEYLLKKDVERYNL